MGAVKYLADTGPGEMRLDYGHSYRLYCRKRRSMPILLCGACQDTQKRDIERARNMARELQNDGRKG